MVGEAVNGWEAVELARRLQPDVALMDVGLPILDGVQATRRIAEVNPAARVIVLTVHEKEDDVFEAIKAGAWGYLFKDADEQVLIEAVRVAHRGEAPVDPHATARVLDEFRRISRADKRERVFRHAKFLG